MTYKPTSSELPGNIPAGIICPHASNNIPDGWLICNGATLSKFTYPTLFNVIGTTYGSGPDTNSFKLPDLRGEFIRGLDLSRGVDSGRVLGSSQSDLFKSHSHNFRGATSGDGTYAYFRTSPNTTYPTYANSGGLQNTGGSETRPRNIAMIYCIKT